MIRCASEIKAKPFHSISADTELQITRMQDRRKVKKAFSVLTLHQINIYLISVLDFGNASQKTKFSVSFFYRLKMG